MSYNPVKNFVFVESYQDFGFPSSDAITLVENETSITDITVTDLNVIIE